MKITPAMTEAGINAMAKAKKSLLSDEALAAAIYSAMDVVRRQEEHNAKGNVVAAKYVHQEWPAWRFGPNGESRLFQKAEDVPESWGDSTQVHSLERDSEVLDGKLDRKLKRKVAA